MTTSEIATKVNPSKLLESQQVRFACLRAIELFACQRSMFDSHAGRALCFFFFFSRFSRGLVCVQVLELFTYLGMVNSGNKGASCASRLLAGHPFVRSRERAIALLAWAACVSNSRSGMG
jgi:hypothetical protein